MNEEKNEKIPTEEEKIEEIENEMLEEANENIVDDYYQEQEEGTIEDFDNHLDEIGFENEKVAEKLTLKKIKQYNEALEKKEKVEFFVEYEGQEDFVYITVDKYFTKTNIVACLQEYIKKLDVLRLKKIDLQSGFLEMYLIFQVIKHFTDLEMPKSIENQLIVMERLINTGLIFKIFAEFPQEEIDKLLEEINQMNENFNKNFEEFEKQLQGMDADTLQSDVMKKQVQKDVENVLKQDLNEHVGENVKEDALSDNSKE
jgi:hypothetical protein